MTKSLAQLNYLKIQKKHAHRRFYLQDYSEEFRDIGGVKGKGKAQLPEGAITLINQRIVTDDLPVIKVVVNHLFLST